MFLHSALHTSNRRENKRAAKFLLVLLMLAAGMGISIYLKQSEYISSVQVWDVMAWQLLIWLPMVLCMPVLRRIVQRKKSTRFHHGLKVAGVLLAIVMLHFCWFYIISKNVSPYLGYPKTKFGVYPFFFIFWITIDFMLVSALGMYYYLNWKSGPNRAQAATQKPISVKQGKRRVLLRPDEILWIAAEDYYTRIHTNKGDFLDRIPLKVMLQKLPGELFLRVHRSSAVNFSAIAEFRSISGYKAELLMTDGTTCPVSKTYLKLLRTRLASTSI